MPAQTSQNSVVFYGEGDTYPPLPAQLIDGAGDPINLTGCTVTLDLVHSNSQVLVEDGSCTVNPDQSTYTGWVTWTPGVGDLSLPGSCRYTFTITYPGGGIQTIPADGYLSLIIKTPVTESV